jgi:hypothetical protein
LESKESPADQVVMMALIRALVVMGIFAVIAYATYALVSGTERRRDQVARAGSRWVATHYAVNGATRIAVRNVRPGTDDVLDEHVIAEIMDSDPNFDTRFLEAMAEARDRAALFESEPD